MRNLDLKTSGLDISDFIKRGIKKIVGFSNKDKRSKR